jgi:predicted heme/steroid binding protein
VPKRKQYTLEELARCTGEDGTPTLIAAHGLVYDVSNSYHRRKGKHQVLQRAGRDLTAELANAPRGAHLLQRVRVVGRLRES